MNELTIEELIERVKLRMDPYWLLETLDLEWEDMVDALRDSIIENYDEVLQELNEDFE